MLGITKGYFCHLSLIERLFTVRALQDSKHKKTSSLEGPLCISPIFKKIFFYVIIQGLYLFYAIRNVFILLKSHSVVDLWPSCRSSAMLKKQTANQPAILTCII